MDIKAQTAINCVVLKHRHNATNVTKQQAAVLLAPAASGENLVTNNAQTVVWCFVTYIMQCVVLIIHVL